MIVNVAWFSAVEDLCIAMIYIVALSLVLELVRCIVKLIYEKKKYETSKREIPLLLDDVVGEGTVYKKTISTSLAKLTKNNGSFTEQKFNGILSGGNVLQNDRAKTSFVRKNQLTSTMQSIHHKIGARKNALSKNISQKSTFDLRKRSRKKLITDGMANIPRKEEETFSKKI
ncbi:unnamed protein product [Litomosoides sigmodontis]|uniref:Uncharacterized protein n=1 Tax=Litomosoides sigmodontis TaxID=42156 RepID=A0A3P6T2L4_LITSI|nr:unnamed protein product [Litomosoides sigmodontis]